MCSLKKINCITLILTLLIINSCVMTYTVKKNFTVPSPNSKKIPLKIGLYLHPNVCSYNIIKPIINQTNVYEFGNVICIGIEKMFRNNFEEVIIIKSLDSNLEDYDVKAVIIPEVTFCNVQLPALIFHKFNVLCRIKYSAVDIHNKTLWVDEFQGEGHKRYNVRNSMKYAIEDHFKKATDGILMSNWWKYIE